MCYQSKFNIPDLPNTKDCHLFIAYTECDAAIVRDIAKYLEAEGFKCCYYERDFQPGRKIIHSINDAIKRSMGIIIILSEESVNSNFCQHEIELAVHTSITEGYTIIPIKVQPCVIPETLKVITYIDAQNKETNEMHILILNAFLHNVWHKEQERANGLTRSIPLTPYEDGLSVLRFKLLVSQNERQSIRMKGFNVSDARFDEMQTLVSSSFHVKYKHIIEGFSQYTGLVFLMLSLFSASFIFAYIAVFFGNEKDSARSDTTSIVLIGSICVTVLIWMVIENELTKKKNSKGFASTWIVMSKKILNRKLWWKINKVTIRTDKYFVFFRDGYLDIIRFDPKPCQVVFERRCRNLKSLTKLVTPGEGETETEFVSSLSSDFPITYTVPVKVSVVSEVIREEYTERLFALYLEQNYTRLTVSSNVYCRHEMKNGASCLCTLLDNDISIEDQYLLY